MVKTIVITLSTMFIIIDGSNDGKPQRIRNKCGMSRTKYNLKSVDNFL